MTELVFRKLAPDEAQDLREQLLRIIAGTIGVALTSLIVLFFLSPLKVHLASTQSQVTRIVFVNQRKKDVGRVRPVTPMETGTKMADRHESSRRSHPTTTLPQRIDRAPGSISIEPSPGAGPGRPVDDAWTARGTDHRFLSQYDRVFGDRPPRIEAHGGKVHFRIKDPVSGKWLIEQAAKTLGFWPPGYGDDPCPGIRKLAGYYRSNPDSSRQTLMERAFELESECSRD